MKVFLLFLSSLFASAILLYGEVSDGQSLPLNTNKKYMFGIEMDKGFVSGIMIMQETDNEVKGSMINEFGVSALDFVYSKKNDSLKLMHVISFLNKWYVKQVLKKDIRLCIHLLTQPETSIPKNYIYQTTGDTVSLTNLKRGIQYRFELSR